MNVIKFPVKKTMTEDFKERLDAALTPNPEIQKILDDLDRKFRIAQFKLKVEKCQKK